MHRGAHARALASLALLALLSCSSARTGKGPLTVATPVDPEGAVLGALVVQALEAKGFTVADRTGFGTADILRAALVAGEVDLVVDYTGAGEFYHEGVDPAVWTDPEKGFETIRSLDRERFALVWLNPAPGSGGDSIVLRREFAEANGLATMADFAAYVSSGRPVKVLASGVFARSRFGLSGFQKAYGFTLRKDQVVIEEAGTTSAMLGALARGRGGVTASVAGATEPSLEKLGLVVLEDPKHVTPVLRPAPVVRAAILKRYPEIDGLLSPVFSSLGDADLRYLDAQVFGGRDPRETARQYLAARGLPK